MGRPSEFSQEVVNEICERMQEGETLAQICRDPELPDRRTVYRWLEAHAEFRLAFARARLALIEFYSDAIIDVSWDTSGDTIKGDEGAPDKCNHEWIARSRLKVDTMKFLMTKINPRQYGDRLTVSPVEGAGEPVQQLLRLERVIVDAPDSHNRLAERIKELEAQLGIGAETSEPQTPRRLTWDPSPMPTRLHGEIVVRLVGLIKSRVPGADQRPPEAVLDELFGVIDRALIAEYGAVAETSSA